MGNRLSESQPGGRRPALKEPGSRQETLTPKPDKCHKFNASWPGDGPFVSHGSGSGPFVTHAIKLNHRLSAENPAGLKGKRTRRHKKTQFQNASARYTSVVIRLADASGFRSGSSRSHSAVATSETSAPTPQTRNPRLFRLC